MATNATLLSGCGYDTMPPLMIREAIIAERDRRGWNNLKLSQESGVPYSRLYAWLNGTKKKTIRSHHIDTLMETLELRVCRGKVALSSPVPKRAKKARKA